MSMAGRRTGYSSLVQLVPVLRVLRRGRQVRKDPLLQIGLNLQSETAESLVAVRTATRSSVSEAVSKRSRRRSGRQDARFVDQLGDERMVFLGIVGERVRLIVAEELACVVDKVGSICTLPAARQSAIDADRDRTTEIKTGALLRTTQETRHALDVDRLLLHDELVALEHDELLVVVVGLLRR